MISVARTWSSAMCSLRVPKRLLLVAQNLRGLNFVHALQAANLLQVLPMVFGAENVGLQIFLETIRALGVVHVKLQMFPVIVIATEDARRMPAEWLMYNGF